MKPEHITLVILGIAVLLLGGWEVYAIFNDKPGDTISEVVAWLNAHPIGLFMFAFLLGVLVGHWFWPMYGTPGG